MHTMTFRTPPHRAYVLNLPSLHIFFMSATQPVLGALLVSTAADDERGPSPPHTHNNHKHEGGVRRSRVARQDAEPEARTWSMRQQHIAFTKTEQTCRGGDLLSAPFW